jgi:hypothetical protein
MYKASYPDSAPWTVVAPPSLALLHTHQFLYIVQYFFLQKTKYNLMQRGECFNKFKALVRAVHAVSVLARMLKLFSNLVLDIS